MAVTETDPTYRQCVGIVRDAMLDSLPDITSGADSYVAIGTDALWADGLTPVATIGHHIFYVTVEAPPLLSS